LRCLVPDTTLELLESLCRTLDVEAQAGEAYRYLPCQPRLEGFGSTKYESVTRSRTLALNKSRSC